MPRPSRVYAHRRKESFLAARQVVVVEYEINHSPFLSSADADESGATFDSAGETAGGEAGFSDSMLASTLWI